MVSPAAYMEMRRDIQATMEMVPDRLVHIEEIFHSEFGRTYGTAEPVLCDDADIIIVVSGTIAGTCRKVIEDLRSKGKRAGMLKIKMFRPFPAEQVRNILGRSKKVAVVDRNFSFGAGGIFAQEIQAALCNSINQPLVFGYIAGLGGRDVTPGTLETIYQLTEKNDMPEKDSVWVGLNE
jgi:pyruvate/2-oxoacid:ferredoxin oxidoreductase alpha subunit